MGGRSTLLRLVIGFAVLAMLSVLFVRSARSTRAVPFTVEREHLTGWTLFQPPRPGPSGVWLALRPPMQLTAPLGRELFARAGESLHYPNPPLVPLLLQHEFDSAFAGSVAPEAIVEVAHVAGLEKATWEPRCVGHRRVSQARAPVRCVYFMLLDGGAFERFRQQLSELLRKAGLDAGAFDPAAVAPVLILAGLDGDFGRWLPLRADSEDDCMAPVQAS